MLDVSSSARLIALPQPSAFALRSIDRHRGTFEESLPTLRFRKPRPRANGERTEPVELLEVVPARPMIRAPRRGDGVPRSLVPETTAELWPDELEPVDSAPVHLVPRALFAPPSPVVVAMPTWTPAPIVRGLTQPYRRVAPGRTAPPDWVIMLTCWLASFVLATALWVATAP